jgi:hypothetical protein
MELYLNYVWVLAGTASAYLWLRRGQRTVVNKRLSLVGLFLFIVILFPVISVTDDLWSVQNPAETKIFELRDQCAACPHSVFPGIAALPGRAGAALSIDPQPFGALLPLRYSLSTIPLLIPSRTGLHLGPDRISSPVHVWLFLLRPAAVRSAA